MKFWMKMENQRNSASFIRKSHNLSIGLSSEKIQNNQDSNLHSLFPINMANENKNEIVEQLMKQMSEIGFCLITNI